MKQVLITGGSRGIGAAAVKCFSEAGYGVSFLYEKQDDCARALSQQTGAQGLRCDIADPKAVAEVFSRLPGIDILINNAAVSHYGLISQISPEEWERVFAVNVNGTFHCIRQVLPHMLKEQKGCILNIASMWGQVGASCEVAYSASKGAVIAMTKALAKELGPSGIRVNCICPGVVETEMSQKLGKETMDALAEESLLGRNGTPEEIAQAMHYLVNAGFVTGQILGVNGGFVV